MSDDEQLYAKVLTVSDGAVAGTRTDESGPAVAKRLVEAGYIVVEQRLCSDGVEPVGNTLGHLAFGFHGLIVTTGGTGFGPRDLTPEGTRRALDRNAPGLAEAMRAVNPLGRLSRGVAGTRGNALILNVAGSTKGAVEMLDAVIDVLPHALRLIGAHATAHPTR